MHEDLNTILTSQGDELPEKGICIVGATGDMVSKRETRDALVSLAGRDVLTRERNPVVLAGSRDRELAEFVRGFREGDADSTKLPAEDLDKFVHLAGLEGGSTLPGCDVSKPEALKALSDRCPVPSALLYVALPPRLYGDTLKSLDASGESKIDTVLLEKPFGTDLKSAQELAAAIAEGKRSVFLIDHFLAYPGLLNMLAFRAWPEADEALRAEHVESLEVRLTETIRSNDRPYFRETGIVVDMVQSHGMMLLASLALELLSEWTGAALQKARLAVLQGTSLKKESARWGQFEGFNDPAAGAPKDAKPTQAETFVSFDFSLDAERWRGVPCKLVNGKGVSSNLFGLVLRFRSLPASLAEKLGLSVGPCELEVVTQSPSPGIWIRQDGVVHSLPFDSRVEQQPPHALLFPDALRGERGLFVSPDEALVAWKFTEELLGVLRGQPLRSYAPGADADTI